MVHLLIIVIHKILAYSIALSLLHFVHLWHHINLPKQQISFKNPGEDD